MLISMRCEITVNAHACIPFLAGMKKMIAITWFFSARLAGRKILAWFENTGLGFLAWAELCPGLNPSPCN